MKINNYIKKNFLVSVSKTVTISLVTLLLIPLIINRVGINVFGVVSLTLLFSGVSSIVDLGLSKAVVILFGEKKISENKVFSSAVYINLCIILILVLVFSFIQFSSIDLLGKDINIESTNKTILIYTAFTLLVLNLLNNLCRSILEAKLLMHISNITLTVFTPLLYITIYCISFFTTNVVWYILTPLILTFLMFVFYVIYITSKTKLRLIKVSLKNMTYVFKSTLSFLNIGLINSMVTPVMRYAFILMVADTGLYAIFDLSFKIAMIANSFIVALAVPMLAVFARERKNKNSDMIKISLNIFYLSIIIFVVMVIGYYLIGEHVLNILNLNVHDLSLLYNITFILILSLGFVAIVEVFYRYFLGNNQLKKAFLLKLIVPVAALLCFFIYSEIAITYRFINAYAVGLTISAFIILITFLIERKKLMKT